MEAAATSLQVPIDMLGVLVLAACGAAVAGKFIDLDNIRLERTAGYTDSACDVLW